MSVLNSLTPDFDDEVAEFVLPHLTKEIPDEVMNISDIAETTVPEVRGYSADIDTPDEDEDEDEDDEAAVAPTPAQPVEDEDEDEDDEAPVPATEPVAEPVDEDDEAPQPLEAATESVEDDLDTSLGSVEEHPLEKNPLEIYTNTCTVSIAFFAGMVTAVLIARATV